MNPTPEPNREKELFSAALELPAADRAAFLSRECAGNDALRERLAGLLHAHAGADEIFPTDPDELTEIVTLSEGPGTVIGKYKLLEQIGEGGMGVVYMAEQSVPFNKRVALKIIKLGMDTKGVVARFEAERQALALMNHPNIAKVLDAGATDTGRPYFVMELVRGMPITEYCDQQKLSTRQRLELFIPVCQAIQHAHQKGIIHRDIKPSNVMVALFDDKPVPMVIDFGIAKATHQRLTEKTLFTRHGQFIGTLEYIAPEQARGSQIDIDTRADVYSLGVLLYQLLTGSTPFPHLREQAWEESMRIIREEEPPRPSTRLSTLTAVQLTGITTTHGGEPPHKISLVLRRELDWIVMACLEKDRSRRYETANGLALDIARYLRGDAPEKAPPSVWYQFGKLARKHKKTFAMAAAIAVILAVATVFSTWQAYRAKKAEELASARAEETLKQKAATDAINGWMRREVLGLLDAWGAEGAPRRADVLLRDVLVQATTNLATQFTNQPVIEADIRYSIGQSLRATERNEAAHDNLRRAYELFLDEEGPSGTNTLTAQIWNGWMYYWRAYVGELGTDSEQKGQQLMEEAYFAAANALGERNEITLWACQLLGNTYLNQGNLAQAAKWAPKVASALGPTPRPADSHFSQHIWHSGYQGLARLYHQQGRQAESRLLQERVQSLHPTTVEDGEVRPAASVIAARDRMVMADYARWWDGDTVECERLLKEGLDMSHQVVGSAHPTWAIVFPISHLYLDLDRFEDCHALMMAEIAGAAEQLGVTANITHNLRARAAHCFGAQADWLGVAGELERQRRLGLPDGLLADELTALHLAGNTEAYRNRRAEYWRRFAFDPSFIKVAPEYAMRLLSLPCPKEEVEALAQLAGMGISARDVVYWGPTFVSLLKGLLAYRQDNFDLAIATLRSVPGSDAMTSEQMLAGYVLAMAERRLGRAPESAQHLARANRWMDGILKRGNLGTRRKDWIHWSSMGDVLALRQEAETVVHDKMVSALPSKETMAASRRPWRQIRRTLDEADFAARRREYQPAVDLISKARATPGFSLEAVYFAEHGFDQLVMPSIMLNDAGACEGFLEAVFPGEEFLPTSLLVPVLQLRGDLPDSLSRRLERTIQRTGLESQWTGGATNLPPRDRLALGLYWLRQGRNADALKALESVAAGLRADWGAAAKAYLAMAKHRTGDTSNAQRLLAEARNLFDDAFVKPDPAMYQADWIAAAMVEQAVKEAGQVIEAEK